jgi:hypothetical protein
MAALETELKLNAQLDLLQKPTSKWGIRHPGYRLIWPQEGGNKPRTIVGVRINGRLRVEYRSDLGQHWMGDIMVLDVTTETGRKIRVVNLYDQHETGRNTATRPARMVNWNRIMNDKTIVVGTSIHIAKDGTRIVVVKEMQPYGRIGVKIS